MGLNFLISILATQQKEINNFSKLPNYKIAFNKRKRPIIFVVVGVSCKMWIMRKDLFDVCSVCFRFKHSEVFGQDKFLNDVSIVWNVVMGVSVRIGGWGANSNTQTKAMTICCQFISVPSMWTDWKYHLCMFELHLFKTTLSAVESV